ncbi:hypothetical protein [Haloarcula sp. H-GB5]
MHSRKRTFITKWLIASVFIWATSFAFFGFLELAPIGIFSNQPTQYAIDLSQSQNTTNATLVANVTTNQVPNGNPGIEIADESFSVLWLVVISLLTALLSVLGCIGHGYAIKNKEGYRSLLECIPNAVIGVGFYIISAICWYCSGVVSGRILHNIVFYIGIAFHFTSIGILLFQFDKKLIPVPKPANLQLYIQLQGQVASGALSVGLALAIGGALTFARAGTRFALPVALIVGVFLFPLSGIAAHRYYRNYKTESTYRYRNNPFT